MTVESQSIQRATNPVRNFLRVFLPVKSRCQCNPKVTGFGGVRQSLAVYCDPWKGGEVKSGDKKLTVEDHDFRLERIQKQIVLSGPNRYSLSVDGSTSYCLFYVCRLEVDVDLCIVSVYHNASEGQCCW